MNEIAHESLDALRRPIEVFFDPSERLYWAYLIGSLLVAAIVWAVARRLGAEPTVAGASGWRAALRRLGSESAVVDYQLLIVVPLLRALLLLPLGVTTLGMIGAVASWLDRIAPMDPVSSWSPLAITIAYTITLFLAWDFSRFFAHWALHRVLFLWAFHKVHHSAETMNPITLYRVHPIESALFYLRGVVTTALVAGLFFHVFRGHLSEFEVVGINVLGFAFNLAGANLRHTHLWLSYGPVVERWLISPAQHQIHHGDRPHEMHSNLGSFLAVWDRMFGTLRLAQEGRPQRFGLPPGLRNHDPRSLASALWHPLVAALRPEAGRRRRESPAPVSDATAGREAC